MEGSESQAIPGSALQVLLAQLYPHGAIVGFSPIGIFQHWQMSL